MKYKTTQKYNPYHMIIYSEKESPLLGYHVFNFHDELILLNRHIHDMKPNN